MTKRIAAFSKSPRGITSLFAVGLLAALFAVGAKSPAQVQDHSPAREHAENLSAAFRDAANQVKPAVVKIITRTKSKAVRRQGENPFKGTPFEGSPFEGFFGREFGGPDGFQMPERQGLGSGVIIDPSGIVLTNNHVVEGADEVVVQLPDGREFQATDPKTDSDTDLAVIRIDPSSTKGDLPHAKLGDSDKLEVGDWVIASGTPFEYEQTVTAGIISGKGRQVGGIKRARFLQTDAAINPGNSGGPLVNLDGEVVGINTAIATSSGGYQGLGFSVPANLAKWIIPQLMESGQVQRAFLGVGIENLNNDLSQYFNVDVNSGALVAQVFPDSPAANAGMEPGDVIQSFNGQEVGDASELTAVVEQAPLGKKVPVQIVRDGKSKTIQVVLRTFDETKLTSQTIEKEDSNAEAGETFDATDLGLSVVEVNAENAQLAGNNDLSGVAIASVEPDSAAAEAGLRRGMVIIRIGRKAIKDVDDFQAAIKSEFRDGHTAVLARVTPAANRWFDLEQSE